MGNLDQRVAIVTGGGARIGRSIALEFAKAGSDVVVASRTLAEIERAAQGIKELGRRSLAVVTDVSIAEQVHNMVNKTIAEFGKIDILVNNAAIEEKAPIVDMPEELWDRIIGINLKGVFLCTQAVAKHMIKQSYGKIINIASDSGIRASRPGLSCYCTSKAAVMQFTRNACLELGPYGINVNAIAPGFINGDLSKKTRDPEQTPILRESIRKATPLGRVGIFQDVAELALFLASDCSSFMSGETITLDGGRNARLPYG